MPLTVPKAELYRSAFLFKAKLVMKTSDPEIINDIAAMGMLYEQAVHDVITSRYPAKVNQLSGVFTARYAVSLSPVSGQGC